MYLAKLIIYILRSQYKADIKLNDLILIESAPIRLLDISVSRNISDYKSSSCQL